MAAAPRLRPSQRRCSTLGRSSFYDGDRLHAEVSLFGAALAGRLQASDIARGSALIQRSHGVATAQKLLVPLLPQARQPEPSNPCRGLAATASGRRSADALMFWLLHRRLLCSPRRSLFSAFFCCNGWPCFYTHGPAAPISLTRC